MQRNGSLAGYEQRDAHEFLQALLDMIGKYCNRYHNIAKKMRQESIPSIYARRLSTFEKYDYSKSDIEGKLLYFEVKLSFKSKNIHTSLLM